MIEEERKDPPSENTAEENAEGEKEVSSEQEKERAAQAPEQKKEVGIFVFLAITVLLVLGAIGFVIYVCSGSATGCNCGQCRKTEQEISTLSIKE